MEKAKALVEKALNRIYEIYPESKNGDSIDSKKLLEAVNQLREEGILISFGSNRGPRITHCWKCWTFPLNEEKDEICPKCGGIICPKCGSCHQDCSENK